jgi:hypothetical protein
MSTVYAKRSDENRLRPRKGQTLRDLLEENGLGGQLDEVALFNWGSKDKAHINRALIELLGCAKLDETEPLNSVLDPDRGLYQALHKPVRWAPALALGKTHMVRLRKRVPAVAVSLSSLARWFDSSRESCRAEVLVEGSAGCVDKLDWEIYAGADGRVVAKHAETTAPGKQEHEWPVGNCLLPPGDAPYGVSVRCYRDAADRETRLSISPFFPRWRGEQLLAESLLVRWTLTGDAQHKVKLGNLRIVDKDGNLLFVAALDEARLSSGQFDLGEAGIDGATLRRDLAPFRIQVQGHSDPDAEAGLAVASMHTLLPRYSYRQVQFVTFDLEPKLVEDTAADLEARCASLLVAVRAAQSSHDVDGGEEVLKVFLAPEALFRRPDDGYPLALVDRLRARLSEETDKPDYLHWLFAFGSAKAFQMREGASGRIVHDQKDRHPITVVGVLAEQKMRVESLVMPEVGWRIVQGDCSAAITAVKPLRFASEGKAGAIVTLAGTASFAPDRETSLIEPITVDDVEPGRAPRIAERIRIPRAESSRILASKVRWCVAGGNGESAISEVHPSGEGAWLTLDPPAVFAVGDIVSLIEPSPPKRLDVHLALRGWPAPHAGDPIADRVSDIIAMGRRSSARGRAVQAGGDGRLFVSEPIAHDDLP